MAGRVFRSDASRTAVRRLMAGRTRTGSRAGYSAGMPAQAVPPNSALRLRGIPQLRWLPAGAAAAVTIGVLLVNGVSMRDVVAFGLYVLLALTVPGTLLWRAAHRRSRSLAEDLAAGTAVGYALEVFCYIPARALGMPILALIGPVATLTAFSFVPGLRRFWRGGALSARPPLWWSWLLAVAVMLLVAWSAVSFFYGHGLTWPNNASPYIDMPFHLALAGELKHHAPPSAPNVLGEPLHYHWFVYTDLAATSWSTGIELQTLLYRLAPLPMLASITVIVAGTAVRVTRAWWSGPVAVGVMYLSFAANPYSWSPVAVSDGQNLFSLWLSPTHLFGLTIFAALVLLLIDLLGAERESIHSRRSAWLPWALLVVMVFAVAGAKATYVPMLVAGLALVVACHAARRRWPDAKSLWALAIAVAGLIFAQFVLFGGTAGAGGLDPLATAGRFAIATFTGLNRVDGTVGFGILMALTVFALLAWAFMWFGAWGLVVGRRLGEPPIQLLVGVCVSGVAATMLLSFPGVAQGYFFRGATPFLAILTAAGLAALLPAVARPSWLIAAAVAAIGFGALTASLVRALGPQMAPTLATHERVRNILLTLAVPWLVLVAVLIVTAVALRHAQRRWANLVGMGILLIALVAMGFGLPQAWRLVGDTARVAASTTWKPTPLADGAPEFRADELAAARWLRANSDPDDVVATNAHCRPSSSRGCDIRHFWISAYSERRVLIEGWGYTTPANEAALRLGLSNSQVPFWDPELYAANAAAFTAPSAEAIMKLRDYGVRWLYADPRAGSWSPNLGEIARMRFQSGGVVIYEIEG